ncbi:CheY-like chemotaxis protein [Mesonia hippocampi]|uniref:CheY-like chemotaxis protein n=1 Tax=Mesonia hippocampi TaxID=1628250 RepID=A0A840EKY0_9FLAO|nr:response regulator [Mesonia hippocampi]MBB4120052.1 CheY-like chemotaxis protein [Mesonia hippocampi]
MKTILLIEDDIALRENTAELIELSGYKVITATNGQEGITEAITHFPDLIICDIMMPKADGYSVLQTLSEMPKTQNIPFIFLSAKTEHKEVRKGMNLGADDYLTKPFDEEDLLHAIESRLAKAILMANHENENNEKILNLHELKIFFDDHGDKISIKKGEKLYQLGEHANYIYLITSGAIKTSHIDENGKELTTKLYCSNDLIGFSSFAAHTTHLENAIAVKNAELTRLPNEEVKQLLKENKQLSLDVIDNLQENLIEVKEQLVQMAYASVRRKTAQTILKFAEVLNKKPSDPIKITRVDLASVAGIAPESLIRTLSSLKKEGLIEIEGRTIKILSLDSLTEIV